MVDTNRLITLCTLCAPIFDDDDSLPDTEKKIKEQRRKIKARFKKLKKALNDNIITCKEFTIISIPFNIRLQKISDWERGKQAWDRGQDGRIETLSDLEGEVMESLPLPLLKITPMDLFLKSSNKQPEGQLPSAGLSLVYTPDIALDFWNPSKTGAPLFKKHYFFYEDKRVECRCNIGIDHREVIFEERTTRTDEDYLDKNGNDKRDYNYGTY